MTMTLTGPAFSPWGRFQLLSLALEAVPREAAAEVLPLVVTAAVVVIRHARGERSYADACAHIEAARAALERAHRAATPTPPPVENRRIA